MLINYLFAVFCKKKLGVHKLYEGKYGNNILRANVSCYSSPLADKVTWWSFEMGCNLHVVPPRPTIRRWRKKGIFSFPSSCSSSPFTKRANGPHCRRGSFCGWMGQQSWGAIGKGKHGITNVRTSKLWCDSYMRANVAQVNTVRFHLTAAPVWWRSHIALTMCLNVLR